MGRNERRLSPGVQGRGPDTGIGQHGCWAGWAAPLTFEALAHAQCQPILGPLHNPRVVEQHTGEHSPLAGHHSLVGWLLAEAGLGPWQSQIGHWVKEIREKEGIKRPPSQAPPPTLHSARSPGLGGWSSSPCPPQPQPLPSKMSRTRPAPLLPVAQGMGFRGGSAQRKWQCYMQALDAGLVQRALFTMGILRSRKTNDQYVKGRAGIRPWASGLLVLGCFSATCCLPPLPCEWVVHP